MSITLLNVTFERVVYDEEGDVLYLNRSDPPRAAAFTHASVEGHALRYGDDGSLIGVTLVGPKFFLDTEGAVTITPPRHHVGAAVLTSALQPAGAD